MPELSEENGQQEHGKKKRKRAKRPGKKRTSQMKREKKAKTRTEGEAIQDSEKPLAKEKKPNARNGVDPDEDLDNRVWVGGLPSDTDEQALHAHFKVCGPVRSIKLLRNTRSVFRGSCFISFRKKSSLDAALELDGTEFKEQTIKVSKAAPPVEKPDFQVFVSGIPKNATEEVLRKDFSECGEISRFKMLRDQLSGKFRGIIFVTYKTKVGVDAALKFHGTEYGGRTLEVRLSSEEKPPSKETDTTESQSAIGENVKRTKMAKSATAQEIADSKSNKDENAKKDKLKRKQHGQPEEEAIKGEGESTGKAKRKKKKTISVTS